MYARVALLFSNPSHSTSRQFSSIPTAKTAVEMTNSLANLRSISDNSSDDASDNSQRESNQALINSGSSPIKSRCIGK